MSRYVIHFRTYEAGLALQGRIYESCSIAHAVEAIRRLRQADGTEGEGVDYWLVPA